MNQKEVDVRYHLANTVIFLDRIIHVQRNVP